MGNCQTAYDLLLISFTSNRAEKCNGHSIIVKICVVSEGTCSVRSSGDLIAENAGEKAVIKGTVTLSRGIQHTDIRRL